MEIRFYDVGSVNENQLSFAVIATRVNDKWVFVQQKAKDTWEIPGGRKEPNEPIFQTARRELFEETGALEFNLQEICDYSVTRQETRYGRLFYAEVSMLGELPDSEIARIRLEDKLPCELTYPVIQPRLLQKVIESLGLGHSAKLD